MRQTSDSNCRAAFSYQPAPRPNLKAEFTPRLQAAANFSFSTPWPSTTARSRPVGVEHRSQPLRRSIDQEQKLREQLFLARHGGQRLDFFDIHQLAVDDAQLELELRVLANPLGKKPWPAPPDRRGKRHSAHALQALQRRLNLGAFCRKLQPACSSPRDTCRPLREPPCAAQNPAPRSAWQMCR
jgi:hypothetical protein